MAASSVPKLYRSVIEDVINSVREAFLDEGIDEQVLIELRQTWEKKLVESKAVDPKEPEHVLSARQVAVQQQQQQQQTAVQIQHQQSQQQQQQSQQQQQQQAAPAAGATTGQMASSGIAHQLTLQPGSLCNILQYTTPDGVDGQKTVTVTMPQKMTITLPAQLTQGGFQTMMSGPATAATVALPPEVAATLLQQATLNQGVINVCRAQTTSIHTTTDQRPAMQYQAVSAEQLAKQPQYVAVAQAPAVTQASRIIQLDGHCDTSDEEEDDDDFQDNDDDRDEDNEDQNDDENEYTGEDEEPLNSEDDVSDADPLELFDTDNVVVCQYDKITRSRNKWKFHLKDGIMNLQGRDYVFQKAVGDAEW